MAPTWPDFDIYTLGTRRMNNGKTAIIWKAETEADGQPYQIIGPLKSNPLLTTAGYVNDVDGAQEILERRLALRIPR